MGGPISFTVPLLVLNLWRFLANFTRFYVVSNSLNAELPSPPTEVRASRGLLRIHPKSATPGSPSPTITSLLNALQLRVNSVDRRPSLGAKPFDNVYFVEVEDDRDQNQAQKVYVPWSEKLKDAEAGVIKAGGEVTTLGSW